MRSHLVIFIALLAILCWPAAAASVCGVDPQGNAILSVHTLIASELGRSSGSGPDSGCVVSDGPLSDLTFRTPWNSWTPQEPLSGAALLFSRNSNYGDYPAWNERTAAIINAYLRQNANSFSGGSRFDRLESGFGWKTLPRVDMGLGAELLCLGDTLGSSTSRGWNPASFAVRCAELGGKLDLVTTYRSTNLYPGFDSSAFELGAELTVRKDPALKGSRSGAAMLFRMDNQLTEIPEPATLSIVFGGAIASVFFVAHQLRMAREETRKSRQG